MPERTGRYFAQVLRRGLRQPFSATVLILGALSSLMFHSALPFAGAIVVVLVYAGLKLRDEPFVRAAIREAQESRMREDRRNRMFRIEELDVESRVRMKTIVKLQSEIGEDVVNSPVDEVAAGLAETVEESEQIVDRGLAMAQKRCELLRYLDKTEKHGIETRIHTLQTKLDQETDTARRTELEAQIALKQQEMEDYNAIESAATRVLEQLEGIEIAFSGLRARLVRIRSTDIADWVAANAELKTELSGLHTAVDSVEKSIEEVLTVRGG